jgi:hypothetical protein
MVRASGAWAVLVAAAVAACGSDPPRASPGSGAAAGMGGAGGAGSGGTGAGGAGSSGTAGGAGASTESYGVVQFGTIFHYPDQGLAYTLATAGFYRARPASGVGPCTTTAFGPCSVRSCEVNPTDPPEPEPEPPPEPDPRPAPVAGDISIRSTGDFTIDLVPDATGIYVQTGRMGTLLGQESVTITATGAEVPAFNHTMTYPLLLLLTEPALAADQVVVTVPRNQDLVLAWDRGVAGLELQLQSVGGTAQLYCNVPSEDGTLTLEAAAMLGLDEGTELLLLGAASERVTAGAYTVTISSAGSVMSPDRSRRPVIVLD